VRTWAICCSTDMAMSRNPGAALSTDELATFEPLISAQARSMSCSLTGEGERLNCGGPKARVAPPSGRSIAANCRQDSGQGAARQAHGRLRACATRPDSQAAPRRPGVGPGSNAAAQREVGGNQREGSFFDGRGELATAKVCTRMAASSPPSRFRRALQVCLHNGGGDCRLGART